MSGSLCAARVVHSKREPYDVYIGRPSKWGNPFSVEEYTRDGAIAAYAEWVKTQPDLLAALPELRGKVLGCWCAPKACHGDVLMAMANEPSDVLWKHSIYCAWRDGKPCTCGPFACEIDESCESAS